MILLLLARGDHCNNALFTPVLIVERRPSPQSVLTPRAMVMSIMVVYIRCQWTIHRASWLFLLLNPSLIQHLLERANVT